MPTSIRRRLAASAIGAAVAAVALSSAVVAPAHAAGKTTVGTQVQTSSSKHCASVGGRNAYQVKGGCRLDDQADGTKFAWDTGGKAAKLEVYKSGSSTLRAKVEFHPKGGWLWVYDTANDHDQIYVTSSLTGGVIYAPTSTSRKIEYRKYPFNYKEGTKIKFTVWDSFDVKPHHKIGTLTGVC